MLHSMPRHPVPLTALLGTEMTWDRNSDNRRQQLLLNIARPGAHPVLVIVPDDSRAVMLWQMVLSLAARFRQGQMQLVLIGPWAMPLRALPHLMVPVVGKIGRLSGRSIRAALRSVTVAAEQRKVGDHLPYIVVVVDDLEDVVEHAGPPAAASIAAMANASNKGIRLIAGARCPQSELLQFFRGVPRVIIRNDNMDSNEFTVSLPGSWPGQPQEYPFQASTIDEATVGSVVAEIVDHLRREEAQNKASQDETVREVLGVV